ncbi:DUF5979 domain-containing protein [Specibacter cremeus]|uniref:DUF5979 domain-containing protein n=1 Tax=Specibacter cremeus TaxID=1629051 RepID=UPI0013DE1457|nr:DUF5979 domain-containing protein [Specibacter cremeus]
MSLAVLGVGAGTVANAAGADSKPTATITKTNDLGAAALVPGTAFNYEIVVTCSGTTDECVDFTIKDTLPEGLVVDQASLPKDTDTRKVTFDPVTRELVIALLQPLDSPVGAVGLKTGTPITFEIGVSLPADSQVADGTKISNTASASGGNFDPVQDTNVIDVSVPKVVNPIATKVWKDGSAVAGSGEASTITLGVRNGSSSSAAIESLTITDDNPDTFENFNFTGASVTAFPKGADTATLRVKVGNAWVAGATITAAGALALPNGANAADVVGVQVIFTNAAGGLLPYDATGGSVDTGMKLRDTYRSTGQPLKPAGKVTLGNCATPSAHESALGDKSGKDACANYIILPDTLVLTGKKTFFPDTDGNFKQDAGEYAVLGENSPVSAMIDVANGSPFPVKTITITEPGPTSEFDKLDLQTIRFRPPAGATSVTVTLTRNGTDATTTYTVAELAALQNTLDGVGVTKMVATYTGQDADGNAAIVEGATAGLDIHGTLNSKVTAEDLPGGTSPGIANCAAFTGDAGRNDGSGTATGTACKDLSIEAPRNDGTGTKTVGQTSVPPGQPIPFTLNLKNNGNKPLITPTIADPPPAADGTPQPGNNPFDVLKLTSASVTPAQGVTLEIFTGGVWVPYGGATPAQLDAATGIKASMAGNLNPTQQLTLKLVTERRGGTANNLGILNCFSTAAGGDFTPGAPACAPSITTGDANAAASLNKNISPATLPEFIPGMQRQVANVALTIFNTGNLSAKTLQLTDTDTGFFDAVDFVKFTAVKMPAGANRVQIDALTAAGWQPGTPSSAANLPAGTNAADVLGIRATFSNGSGNFVITPCPTDPTCRGTLNFGVSPRAALRSDATKHVTGTLANTAGGSFQTVINTDPTPIGDVTSGLELVPGDAALTVNKTQDTSLAPGETAPFYLKVTNSGTANLPNVVVKDLLPAGLAFDETFKGDNGQPFKVTGVQVPAGTPTPPTPAFTPVVNGEKIDMLVWDFGKNADGSPFVLTPGSTFTIEIRAGLAPGVTAGQILTNTMGATSSHPKLSCSPAAETAARFGDGTYCTGTATVKVTTGAAFQARKWVAGTPSLGWYNTLTKQSVAVGGPTCPVTTGTAGAKYTAYPCIAMVNPGDTFQYLLRVVNAGTESGTDMRIVDRLPGPGDKTVVGNLDRGTQWDTAPTLATEPTLTGDGATMATLYSTKDAICTDDLKMGGAGSNAAQCPASAWNAPFGPNVTGLQFRLTFNPKLAPGKGVEIAFTMKAPMDVTQKADPTIAWNSYGHAETTDKNGSAHVLPPTEPIQVGVALAYGSLQLQKKIGDNPSKLPLANLGFPFHVTCAITPVGGAKTTVLEATYQVSSAAPVGVTGIPANADCSVWEEDAKGGFTDHGKDHPVTVTIKPGLGVPSVETVAITNDFPDAVVELTKKVTGDGAGFAQPAYPMNLFCAFHGTPVAGYNPKPVLVPVAEPRFVTAVPPGSDCHAVETDDGGATEVTYLPAGDSAGAGSGPVTTTAGTPQHIAVTNDFRTGSLVISKEVTGSGAPELAQGPFTYHVVCSFNGKDGAIDKSITIPKGAGGQDSFLSAPLTGLPAGADCLVTETDNGGADYTPGPVTVAIKDGGREVAGFTGAGANTFSAGTIGLAKELKGDAAGETYAKDAVFSVLVTCERDVTGPDAKPLRTTVFSRAVGIRGGQVIAGLNGADGKPVKLPVGTHCFGVETNTGGATTSTVDHNTFDNAAVVTKLGDPSTIQALSITAVNTFDYGRLAVTKKVDGAAAGFVGKREFTLSVTCALPQGGSVATAVVTDQRIVLKGGESATVEKLPVGARCDVTETNTGGASGVVVDYGTGSDGTGSDGTAASLAVVGGKTPAAVMVTNTFDAGLLTVTKMVVNGNAGPYSFTLACTTGQGPVVLAAADAAFTLKDGESRTISVPNSADCVVAETFVPDGDAVSYTTSAGGRDGKVAVTGTAAVHVTNTFKAAPLPPAGGGAGSGLGSTGAAGIGALTIGALAALIAGLVLVRRNRRTRRG